MRQRVNKKEMNCMFNRSRILTGRATLLGGKWKRSLDAYRKALLYGGGSMQLGGLQNAVDPDLITSSQVVFRTPAWVDDAGGTAAPFDFEFVADSIRLVEARLR